MVSIEGLHKRFGSQSVLNGIDLEINPGRVTALLGPNGAGKTTLIKSVLGMTIPDSGTIKVMGTSIKENVKYRKNIDYLPQNASFPGNLRVSELIEMIKDMRGYSIHEESLKSHFDLAACYNKKLNALSGGTKQKINIVLACMYESPILILDEPTTGLDPVANIRLKKIIREKKHKGITIIVSSHIMSFINEVADDIVFLLEGKLFFNGSMAQLKSETGQKNFEHAIAHIFYNRQ